MAKKLEREEAYRIGRMRLRALQDAYRKLAKLTPEEIDKLVDKVAHVGDGEIVVRREYNLTADEMTELMMDKGYEKCPKCKWFVETSELIGEDNEPTVCSNCQ